MQASFTDYYGSVLDVGDRRASLIANNIANADTPGFKARDVDFSAALQSELSGAPDMGASNAALYRAGDPVTLDGNDVSLDKERLEALQNGQQMMGASIFLHQDTANLITALRPNPGGI
ncbi:flagellar basal body rod protein FlgB [Acidisoma sp. C75]